MNGFYISVSNGLLTTEHRERIGAAIWEFMWCLDKVTKIDGKGIGYILGGKPIKLADLAMQMGTSEDTASRNLNRLKEQGYISLLRTPYGLVIKVMKAKKRFYKNAVSEEKIDTAIMRDLNRKNAVSLRKNAVSNKTVSVDSTVDNISITEHSSDGKEVNEIIDLFREVNPSFKKLFGSPPQRKAVQRLLDTHGREQLEKAIRFLKKSNTLLYFPVITTPVQLENDFGKLVAQSQKLKNNQPIIL